jgi:hypothetical protein
MTTKKLRAATDEPKESAASRLKVEIEKLTRENENLRKAASAGSLFEANDRTEDIVNVLFDIFKLARSRTVTNAWLKRIRAEEEALKLSGKVEQVAFPEKKRA